LIFFVGARPARCATLNSIHAIFVAVIHRQFWYVYFEYTRGVEMLDLNSHILESVMLICFGISWPFSIIKTVRSKTVAGKSIVFNLFILTGYCAGVGSKVIGEFDPVVWFYLINGLMISTDLMLYLRYSGFNLKLVLHRLSCSRRAFGKWVRCKGLEKTAV
jgi:hypothetical protein